MKAGNQKVSGVHPSPSVSLRSDTLAVPMVIKFDLERVFLLASEKQTLCSCRSTK